MTLGLCLLVHQYYSSCWRRSWSEARAQARRSCIGCRLTARRKKLWWWQSVERWHILSGVCYETRMWPMLQLGPGLLVSGSSFMPDLRERNTRKSTKLLTVTVLMRQNMVLETTDLPYHTACALRFHSLYRVPAHQTGMSSWVAWAVSRFGEASSRCIPSLSACCANSFRFSPASTHRRKNNVDMLASPSIST